MTTIFIRCTRPCLFRGQPLRAGELVGVDALTAADMLSSTRVELVKRTDREAIAAAIRADNARKCSRGMSALPSLRVVNG